MTGKQKRTILICTVLTLLAIIALFTGIYFRIPLIIAFTMIPVIIYEMIKAKGIHTKFFSFLCLIIAVTGIYSLIIGLNVDMSGTAGGIFRYIPGLPGSVHAVLISSVIIIILSFFLLRRTAGIYARWLSVIIIILAAGLFYVTNPAFFSGKSDAGKTQDNSTIEINTNTE